MILYQQRGFMTRTTNFFLIHNFNTIPTELTELCEDYILYDCSNDMNVKKNLRNIILR